MSGDRVLTLTDFLLQRIGEDEAEARYCPTRTRALAEVEAKRRIVARESIPVLSEWTPDCGGEWVLSGPGYFANYWPDNTVSASILDPNDDALAKSGIVAHPSRATCQAFAEQWIAEHWQTPNLLDLALPYADHQQFRKEWRA